MSYKPDFSRFKNYMTDSAKADFGVGRWVAYADAAGTRPVDGTGGSPTVTFTRSTTSPLSGIASFLLTKDAANRQGEGASCSFAIDSADQSKVLQISFDYAVSSGTFVAGSDSADSDVIAYLYDVTNAVLIEPTPFRLFSNSSNSSRYSASFQTNTGSGSYRLILHVASTSASAYTLKFDNFELSSQPVINASLASDWVSYTPTLTGFGTATGIEFESRRVADELQIRGKFTAGTPTAVEARASFPTGLTSANTTKIPSIKLAGYGTYNAAASLSPTMLIEPSVTYLTFGRQDGSNAGLTKQTGSGLIGAGSIFSFFASVPIAGWVSQTQSSDQSQNRVISTSYKTLSGSQTSSGSAQLVSTWSTLVVDKTGSFSGGIFTVPENGIYSVSAILSLATNVTGFRQIYIYQNGSSAIASPAIAGSATLPTGLNVSGDLNCIAGDTISIFAYQDSGGNLAYDTSAPGSNFSISKVQGPVATLPTEKVVARYKSSSGQSIANSGSTIIDFATKDTDSHNAVTTGGSWKFTAPVSGNYHVSSAILFDNSVYTASSTAELSIYKNGVFLSDVDFDQNQTAGSWYIALNGSDTIPMVAGDYIQMKTSNGRAGGATLLIAAPEYNYIAIHLVK